MNDDYFICREVARPLERRKIPTKQLLRCEALAAFKEWAKNLDRIPYGIETRIVPAALGTHD